MPNQLPHICVCICTYQRTDLLKRLLEKLARQEGDAHFTLSIVVADNDRERSAQTVVEEFSSITGIECTYRVEPEPNIPRTRNLAIAHAEGDYVAFIDDDELPISSWLLTLFHACKKYGADGALGPVKPHFDETPPGWIVKGNFHDRPSYPTGHEIHWRQGRTGNVLLKSHVFEGEGEPFRPAFRTGEDQDFFRRMIEKGHLFVWCHEALAYEVVPAARCKLSFLLRRALFRGQVSLAHPGSRVRQLMKSAVAVPLYALALPFLLIRGPHAAIQYLVKICDHLGRLLAGVGINPIKTSYVSE